MKLDIVEWLDGHANAVSNLGRPRSDNNYGRAAAEIERLRSALEKIRDTREVEGYYSRQAIALQHIAIEALRS